MYNLGYYRHTGVLYMEYSLSFNFFTLVYFSTMFAMAAAYYEYKNIGLCSNHDFYSHEYVNNSELVIASINCILTRKWGELMVFAYPISLISSAIAIFISLKINGVEFKYNITPSFLLIISIIVGLHIFVPYIMTYLRQASAAEEREISVKEWFNYAFMNISSIKKLESKLTSKKVKSPSEYKLPEYDKYSEEIMLLSKETDIEIEPFTLRMFKMYLPFYSKYNTYAISDGRELEISVSDKKDASKLIVTEVELKQSMLFSSTYSVENIYFLLGQRVFETAIFFAILTVLYSYKL